MFLLGGPTGAGKTDWAIRLAERAPVEIVSVDSALVYRGLDIGTAQPPKPAPFMRQPITPPDLPNPRAISTTASSSRQLTW